MGIIESAVIASRGWPSRRDVARAARLTVSDRVRACPLDDPADDVAFDELALFARGLSKRSGGEPVKVAHRAEGGLV